MTAMHLTHGTENFVMRSVDIERDAEKLAQMWNASDAQWPGTWTEGVPMTAERVREWYAREQAVDTLIWDTGEAIAGYCSLWRRPHEEDVTYIALLNVAPDYQQLGLARRFLTHYVERVSSLGSIRLDLDTWSGNLKAVPLYKKCGFFWVPGTSVDMQNYLPAILRLPVARDFLERHDWYQSLQRDLSQGEDDERWQGMKVFTYRFEAGGERLSVWIDREARAITAVETDDFLAAAIADESEPARGLPATLRWRLVNKRAEPLMVSVIASGTTDLKLDYRQTIELAPGEDVTLEAAIQVVADAAGAPSSKAAPAVRSVLVLGGQVLELATGLRPRAAVEVSTEPEAITLTPGVPQTVRLDLRSHLKHESQATISLTPAPGLCAEWTQQRITLAADAYRSLTVTLTALAKGVYRLPILISIEQDGEVTRLPVAEVTIFALPLGGVLGAVVDGALRIENEAARFIVEPEGGLLTVFERLSGRKLLEYNGYAAPPAWPSEFRRGAFELRLLEVDGEIVAKATMASETYPGLVLHKHFTISAGTTVRVEYDLENRATEARQLYLRHALSGDHDRATLTLPLAAGIGRGSWSVFPGPSEGPFGAATNFAERWAAIEYQQATVGVVWADDVERVEWSTLQTRAYDCPPQSHAQPAPLYLSIGEGGWRAVRQRWRRLSGVRLAQATPAEAQAPLAVRTEPPAAIVADESATVTLRVENLTMPEVEGRVTLDLPEGWQADVTEFATGPVNWQRSFSQPVQLMASASPGPAVARISLRSAELDVDVPLPLIRLGDGGSIEVRETGAEQPQVLTIDNGPLQIVVTPGHGGTVSGVREGEINHLASPYPAVGTLGWMSPWYGGLTPVLLPPGDWFQVPGPLWKASFAAEPVEQRDGRGIRWHGTRQRASALPEALRGLSLEIDTLTVGGSPVIKQVMRIRALEPIRRYAAGFLAFAQPDGDHAATIVWADDWQVKSTGRIIWRKAGGWVAAENPATGRALALISPSHETGLAGWGSAGNYLELLTRFSAAPGEIIEIVGYLVVAASVAEARQWAALQSMR